MLVISRRHNENLLLGKSIEVKVLSTRSDSVRLGITAPRSVNVVRGELLEQVKQQNISSAALTLEDIERLPQPKRPGKEISPCPEARKLACRLLHDLRNLLTPIQGELQLSILDCQDPYLRESLEAAETGIRSLNHSLEPTNNLVRGGAGGELLSLNEALLAAIEAWTGKTPVVLAPDALPIEKFRSRSTVWVLNELFKNAEEAGARRITLSVVEGSNGATITVTDDGHGIDRSSLEKVGKPFFSTRDRKRGLGLCTVANWLSRFDGKLQVSSKLGQGTEIRMFLVSEIENTGPESSDPVVLRGEFQGVLHKQLER